MSFFGKLKDRLFKSSSKIEQGLDAIVEDGGEAEAAAPEAAVSQPSEPAPTPDHKPEPEPEPALGPGLTDDVDDAFDQVAQVGQGDLNLDELTHDQNDTLATSTGVNPQPEEQPTPAPVEDPAPQSPVEAPQPVDVPPPAITPEAPPIEVPTPVEPPRPAAPVEAPQPVDPTPAPPASDKSAQPKPGLLGRLLGRTDAAPVIRRVLDDDMLESLEELLITTDMGVDTALRITANMAEGRMGRKLSTDEIKRLLADEITRIMDPVAKPLPIYPKKPQVVLVVGVNGSGKTTTIGKLASQLRGAGKSVVIAAGDTFRAAAVEQLQIWGDRAGVPVLTAPQGSDPASLAYDAMVKAEQDGADLLMIDTAGRLQNRADLMEELSKIVRVIRKKDPTAPHNTLLVLDATTGQNALNQVEIFQKLADVSGLVMTKLDGTAKGGVLVALADKFGLPIHAIGVGEQIDDLAPFDPEEFARALTGLEA